MKTLPCRLGLFLSIGLCVFMAPLAQSESHVEPNAEEASVYVEFRATTWKPRGRLYYDVHGSILRKLATAGLRIVRDEREPHALTLSVTYDEARGEAYGVDAHGTNVHAEFVLTRSPSETSWIMDVVERSENSISGTPPYIDVIQKFEANPYYFFLGDILVYSIRDEVKVIEALRLVLQQIAHEQGVSSSSEASTDRFLRPEHSMISSAELYRSVAIARCIDELVQRNDRQAIPAFSDLIGYPDARVRLQAIEALGAFEVVEFRHQIATMAKHDPDDLVRQTAQLVFERLAASVSNVE